MRAAVANARLCTRMLLAGTILLSGLLIGCSPASETATLPPATIMIGPKEPPPSSTPLPPTTTQVPTVAPTEKATATAVQEVSPTRSELEPISVTILHTNDVMGEVDPCG